MLSKIIGFVVFTGALWFVVFHAAARALPSTDDEAEPEQYGRGRYT